MTRIIVIVVLLCVNPSPNSAQSKLKAVVGPGHDAHWPTAAKDGFGTSNTSASKIWFTLAEGVLTEVFYPRLDVPNVQCLQLLIVSGNLVETERDDTTHQTQMLDDTSLVFRQINTAKSGQYKITKSYVTDPRSNTVLIDIKVEAKAPHRFYVYYDPSLNNSGMHDSGWIEDGALVAADHEVTSALISSSGFELLAQRERDFTYANAASRYGSGNGFLGVNDGLTVLRNSPLAGEAKTFSRAEDGNVVQVATLRGLTGVDISGRVIHKGESSHSHVTLALAFARTAREAVATARSSLAKGFPRVSADYKLGWSYYVRNLPVVEAKFQKQFRAAAMVLHGLEDKTFRGATIASPSIPWGGGPNANENTISGYHAVWARDLYHVATALLALGDVPGANRALDYLFYRQQKPDGSFPQNSRVDGRTLGGGVQMDQVAFPIVLAVTLKRTDKVMWLKHIKPAAEFIVHNGPGTNQDRWEEKSGYSPATIAAEIAGLVCAAEVAKQNGEIETGERYLGIADNWASKAVTWTATKTGSYGNGSYYLRLSGNEDPNDGASMEINSNGGTYDERTIVDNGFLEFVRLGIRRVDDSLVVHSLEVSDKLLKKTTPNGVAFYRYNHDAYGERPDGEAYDSRSGKGRLWTLLAGERGEFELAREGRASAIPYLESLMGFANQGLMIPEQVWDQEQSPTPALVFGKGTGSATPLAWSLAQFIRLAVNIKAGRNLETPSAVIDHYRNNAK